MIDKIISIIRCIHDFVGKLFCHLSQSSCEERL